MTEGSHWQIFAANIASICSFFLISTDVSKIFQQQAEVDTGYFRRLYTDFRHTILGKPKFNLR